MSFLRLWLLSVVYSCFIINLQGQSPDIYLFPINPGQANYLAGTMGELRSSHFHAGLDIKTGGQIGLPVYATADGYVNRIRVGTGGYGYALYLTHPNGTTSVYAHLSKFHPEIEKYILTKQYEEESFEIQQFPSRELFPFKRGDLIGYSGNTGSSSGPHLHFEIRDQNQRILDPLKFNFSEIKDDITPQMKSIAFVTLNGESRVNNTYGRFEFDVIKSNGIYHTVAPVVLEGNIGVEIYAYDLLNGVYNRNGISKVTLMVDGDTMFSELKSQLAFSKQRNILVHMDYERYVNGGRKFNKLFVDDGNTQDFYTRKSRGVNFNNSPHTIRIFLEDSYQNISTFEMNVNTRGIVNRPRPQITKFQIYRNHLHFESPGLKEGSLTLYFGDTLRTLLPYREDRKKAYYLWDLREGLPDSIDYFGEHLNTGIYGQIPSNQEITFVNHHWDLEFGKNSLFDTLYLGFDKSLDTLQKLELFAFPHNDFPFKGGVTVKLKPSQNYPDSTARAYSFRNDRLSYIGGKWQDSTLIFDTRELTTFTIAEDTLPPEIEPRIINNKELYFKIRDDLSGIKSYRATLNGQFLLMAYEHKREMIWAVPKDENIHLIGELILEVEDNTGNKTIYQKTLK